MEPEPDPLTPGTPCDIHGEEVTPAREGGGITEVRSRRDERESGAAMDLRGPSPQSMRGARKRDHDHRPAPLGSPRSGRTAPSAGQPPVCDIFDAQECDIFDAHWHPGAHGFRRPEAPARSTAAWTACPAPSRITGEPPSRTAMHPSGARPGMIPVARSGTRAGARAGWPALPTRRRIRPPPNPV